VKLLLKTTKIQRVHTYIMTEHKELPHSIIWTFTPQCNIPCWNAHKQLHQAVLTLITMKLLCQLTHSIFQVTDAFHIIQCDSARASSLSVMKSMGPPRPRRCGCYSDNRQPIMSTKWAL